MAAQQGFRIGPQPGSGRLEVGDGLSAPDDGEVLASVLDRVEDVGEVSGCFGRTHFWHEIRLSDSLSGSREVAANRRCIGRSGMAGRSGLRERSVGYGSLDERVPGDDRPLARIIAGGARDGAGCRHQSR